MQESDSEKLFSREALVTNSWDVFRNKEMSLLSCVQYYRPAFLVLVHQLISMAHCRHRHLRKISFSVFHTVSHLFLRCPSYFREEKHLRRNIYMNKWLKDLERFNIKTIYLLVSISSFVWTMARFKCSCLTLREWYAV